MCECECEGEVVIEGEVVSVRERKCEGELVSE